MKKITKARILQKLVDRLGLQEYTREAFTFGEQVCPVYEIKTLVMDHKANDGLVSISANGEFIYTDLTTPDNETWELLTWAFAHTTGTYTVDYAYIINKQYSKKIFLTYTPITATGQTQHFPTPLPMSPGDQIAVNISNYSVTGWGAMYISYLREKVR